ncbi:NAD(P)-dependent oxidoreductase [Nocardioides sp. 503]|uniref:NAD(P)-dependent oxidoreductase n=1 Tax=Nocardioides sp. 503 TaxID=2508326 RepID=UPI0014306B52|nr:NAD(P)-dependent oxidoreductase [Nocardioides sp. 503]
MVVADDVRHRGLAGLAPDLVVRHVGGTGGDAAATIAALQAADAVLVRNRTVIGAAVLEACPHLRAVARFGVGLDNIDLPAADRAGVVVLSLRGANAVSVAEHALGLALALARRTVTVDRSARLGGWDRRDGRELHGGTWGVLGAGATGSAVAVRARALGMRTLAHDPGVPDLLLREAGIKPVGIEDLARRSDVLSVHVPGGAATRGLVDRHLLGLLPDGAYLVNLSRGDVVDEDAVLAALESGRLGGAALDVRREEPPVVGALERRDDVVLTPHVGGLTTASTDRIVHALVDDLRRLFAGEPAHHAVGAARHLTPPAEGAP